MQRRKLFSQNEIDKATDTFRSEIVSDISAHSVFNTAILSILEGAEKRRRAELNASSFYNLGYSNPHTIIDAKDEMANVLYNTRWPTVISRRIVNLSEWWVSSGNVPDVVESIMLDASNGRSRGYRLREMLAEEAPGLGYKSAAVLMLRMGYSDLIPVDTHECRLLKEEGFSVKVPDYKTRGLPQGKSYFDYEAMLLRLVRREGTEPAVFHHAVLNRAASIHQAKGNGA